MKIKIFSLIRRTDPFKKIKKLRTARFFSFLILKLIILFQSNSCFNVFLKCIQNYIKRQTFEGKYLFKLFNIPA